MYEPMNKQTQECIVQLIRTADAQMPELAKLFWSTEVPFIDGLKKWVEEGKASPAFYNNLNATDCQEVDWERVVTVLHSIAFLPDAPKGFTETK